MHRGKNRPRTRFRHLDRAPFHLVTDLSNTDLNLIRIESKAQIKSDRRLDQPRDKFAQNCKGDRLENGDEYRS